MNSHFLLQPIPIERITEIANCHFQDVIPIIDSQSQNSVYLSVPPGNNETPFTLQSVGNYDFVCTHIVATYTTLTIVDDAITDDAVSRLLFNLDFGGWNRSLARNFFPVEQFFTPGRVRSSSATNNTGANQCSPPVPLLIPRPLPVLLLKTQALTLTLKNADANAVQVVTMSLHGWRVTVKEQALKAILDSMAAKANQIRPS